MKKIFLDVECYSNYFLVYFKSKNKDRFYQLTENSKLNLKEIKNILTKYLTIGFNSRNYDLPMIVYALMGADNKQLKELSDKIITSGLPPWEIRNEYNIHIPSRWDHIDLIEPAPAVHIGLKMYGARMHTRILQDLPLEPDTIIKEEDHPLIRRYCLNDVDITIQLYDKIKDRLELREKIGEFYNMDFRSKSDAQIAESIIKHHSGIKFYNNSVEDKPYYYNPPEFIKFCTTELKDFFEKLKNTDFRCNEKGKFVKNKEIENTVEINYKAFSVGVGGLHSNEKNQATTISEDEFLLDVDVVSYYPSIILNNNYYPEHIGEKFISIYRNFYNARIKAKNNNDKIKSDTYKIILNGSFGKFGSRFSSLYSPNLLLHTTLTGQLALLMLIEKLIVKGFTVISANTDGVTVKGKKKDEELFNRILQAWEELSQFKLEKTPYRAIYHESVNSYIALMDDNKVKCKGLYSFEGLDKNPVSTICIEAVIEYLQNKIPVSDTILKNADNIKKFLIIRKVEGGAVYKEQYLGKIVRWYYSTNGDRITYKKNENKVAGSDGAIPLMILPDREVKNIDFQKYIEKSYTMLKNLGVNINGR